jgi:hypothetical protein
VDITSNTFYKRTATYRTHYIYSYGMVRFTCIGISSLEGRRVCSIHTVISTKHVEDIKKLKIEILTPSLLMSYICGAPCKARNFNIVYIYIYIYIYMYICMWTYVWQRWKPSLSIFCTMFQHWINAESYSVAQLCVNTLLATKVILVTNGI